MITLIIVALVILAASYAAVGIFGITPTAGQENPRDLGFLISEQPGRRSRDQVILDVLNDASTKWLPGTVCGQKVIGTTAAGATASTGFTFGTITTSAGVKEGVYRGVWITGGSATTSKAELFDPNGILVGVITIASAFSAGGLAFTLADAGAHPVVGETFTITVGTAAFALTGGDTGNPTCSAIVVDPGVIGGTYTFTMTDATHFSGVDPNGRVLPNGVFGAAYKAGGVEFTITAGATPCIAGDSFTIIPNTGSLHWAPVSATAADGTQNAAGILGYLQDVSGATALKVLMITRAVEVKDTELAWPSAATDDQVQAWIAQLAALGIIVRSTIK